MRAQNLWILCIVSIFLIAHRFIPGLHRYEIEIGAIGLAVSAVLAYRGMKSNDNAPQYKSILALSVFSLVITGAIVLFVVLMFSRMN